MEGLICFLEKWQTLLGAFIGALIGGIIGFLAAWYVARDARSREERAAAILLVGDLMKVKAAWEALSEFYGEGKLDGEKVDVPMMAMIIDRLIQARPILSPLFESSMARISVVNYDLAAHLRLFHESYSQADRILSRLEAWLIAFRQGAPPYIKKENLIAYSKSVKMDLSNATKWGKCAIYLLEKLILGKNGSDQEMENECRTLLEKGAKGE